MAGKQKKIGKHSAEAVQQHSADDAVAQQTRVMEPITHDVSDQETVAIPAVDGAAASSDIPRGAPQSGYAVNDDAQNGFAGMNPAQPYDTEGQFPGWSGVGDDAPKKPRDKKKIAKVVGIIVGILAVVYFVGVVFFMGHFYPNSTIGGTDVSLKSGSDVASLAESKSNSYSVNVTGDGLNFSISAQEAGLDVDGNKVANTALAANSAFAWPYQITQKHDETQYLAAEYNSNGLSKIVKQKVEDFNATATPPTNATIAYSDSTAAFAVQAEKLGTQLDEAHVLATVDDAVTSMATTATLTQSDLVQPTVLQDNPALATAAQAANGYIKADLKLVMGDNNVQAAEITPKQIADWVKLDANLQVTFDTDAMNDWVSQLADSLNTVGSKRTYTRPDGLVITVTGGSYGWAVDNDALTTQVSQAITAGKVATITVPTTSEGATFAGAGTKDWGAYVDVNTTEQHARYYNAAGTLVWESDVVTGKPDGEHETPEGVWVLYNMESPSTLKGQILASTGAPEYETKVAYWMAFTETGCGLHDATWQSAFGGTRYADGYGSHGCVNLPYSAAQELYSLVSVGDAVVIHS